MIIRKIALTAAGVTMVASAVFASAASAKDEPQVLQPSSNWHLDYAEKYCRLLRTFGEGDDKVVLIMDQSRPGDAFSMTVAGSPVADLRLDPRHQYREIQRDWPGRFEGEKVEVRFGPGEDAREVNYLKGELGPYEPAVIFGSLTLGRSSSDEEDSVAEDSAEPGSIDFFARDISMERTRNVEWLQLSRRGTTIRLATGPMTVPIEGMQACMEELALHWDIDVPAHRTLSRVAEAANNPATWIGPQDYPHGAIMSGAQAVLNYRLTIGADGKPTDCEIVRFTNATDFDAVSCKRMMQRAEFTPALDAQGQPIKSVEFGTIMFQMP